VLVFVRVSRPVRRPKAGAPTRAACVNDQTISVRSLLLRCSVQTVSPVISVAWDLGVGSWDLIEVLYESTPWMFVLAA